MHPFSINLFMFCSNLDNDKIQDKKEVKNKVEHEVRKKVRKGSRELR